MLKLWTEEELAAIERTIIGSSCFKGTRWEGSVEIGYGLDAEFQRCGNMSKAVRTMCAWVFRQPACGTFEGVASQRLLQQLGFER